MKALASFIMRGRMQATLVSVVGAVLSLMIPPLSHLSGATIALVTLRNGPKEGVFLLLSLGLVVGLVGSLSSLDGGLVKAYVIGMLLLSVPVLLAAVVLRMTRSLGQTLTAIALMAAFVLVLANLLMGDIVGWWRSVLDSVMLPVLSQTPDLSAEEADQMLNGMARMMTGLVAAVMLYSTMINLSLARWFQAMLYNPGGFQQEFHSLQLDRRVAITAALIGASGMLMTSQSGAGLGGGISQDLMILVVALFSIHGLALVHGVVTISKMGRGWLIALYVGLLLVPPHIAMILAMVGFIDCWVDFRGRVRKRLGIDSQHSDGSQSGSDLEKAHEEDHDERHNESRRDDDKRDDDKDDHDTPSNGEAGGRDEKSRDDEVR